MSREFLDLLRRDGVVASPEARLVALTGGVSSEIFRLENGPRVFVVKRAPEKLLLRPDWHADLGRNRFERLYLETVGRIVPGSVPRVLAAGEGYFTTEWLGHRAGKMESPAPRPGGWKIAGRIPDAGKAGARSAFCSLVPRIRPAEP